MKEENQALIKALNMYGRVPEMWELLEEIERLNNIINEAKEFIEKYDFITGYYEHNYDDVNDTYTHYTVKEELLEILDKGE